MAALRIAGPDSQPILEQLFQPTAKTEPEPFLMRHGHLRSKMGQILDEILAVYMPAGRSYTGLDQVELFCHGGQQLIRIILEEIIKSGARPAEPGEFTKLAFLNGKLDLSEAEAVAEMIAASTRVSLEAGREHLIGSYSAQVERIRGGLLALLGDVESSIDFTEDDIAPPDRRSVLAGLADTLAKVEGLAATYDGGRIVREGFKIAVAGRPNAGKSSLFNILLEQERALVDPEPGTTRDYLSEWIDLDGFAVNIIDTAGLRADAGAVEQQGQAKALDLMKSADLVIWMADVADTRWQKRLNDDLKSLENERMLLVGNKIDVAGGFRTEDHEVLALSCLNREGVPELRRQIIAAINEGMPDLTSGQVVTSARHKDCLDRASQSLTEVRRLVKATESPEIVAFELRRATDALGEITGKVYTEEILGEIFSRFCIGK